jgi:hypothetical protein
MSGIVNEWKEGAIKTLEGVLGDLPANERPIVQALIYKIRNLTPTIEDFADLLFMLMQASDRIPKLKGLYRDATQFAKYYFLGVREE